MKKLGSMEKSYYIALHLCVIFIFDDNFGVASAQPCAGLDKDVPAYNVCSGFKKMITPNTVDLFYYISSHTLNDVSCLCYLTLSSDQLSDLIYTAYNVAFADNSYSECLWSLKVRVQSTNETSTSVMKCSHQQFHIPVDRRDAIITITLRLFGYVTENQCIHLNISYRPAARSNVVLECVRVVDPFSGVTIPNVTSHTGKHSHTTPDSEISSTNAGLAAGIVSIVCLLVLVVVGVTVFFTRRRRPKTAQIGLEQGPEQSGYDTLVHTAAEDTNTYTAIMMDTATVQKSPVPANKIYGNICNNTGNVFAIGDIIGGYLVPSRPTKLLTNTNMKVDDAAIQQIKPKDSTEKNTGLVFENQETEKSVMTEDTSHTHKNTDNLCHPVIVFRKTSAVSIEDCTM